MGKIANKENKNLMYSIIEQITCIMLFFALFFVTAQVSPYNGTVWPDKITDIISVGVIAFPIIGFSLLIFTIIYYRKSTEPIMERKDWIAIGCMISVQYLIRASMVGTIQMGDGLNCYRSLKEVAANPELFLTNFIEAGKLADRKAYGYVFFAIMGEFLTPNTGLGLQWSQVFMGIGAACCIYRIFRVLLPKCRVFVLWCAAVLVSVQPMFLGMSTICGLEFGMTVFFIYALYACVNKKYILMIFWLIMLGTTKGSGFIMALAFVGAFVVGHLVQLVITKKAKKVSEQPTDTEDEGDEYDVKTGAITVAAMAAVSALIYGVVKICVVNGIAFDGDYIKIKSAQLFILNFNWIWWMVIIIGIIMIAANKRVRKTNVIDIIPVFVVVICYVIYDMYLLAYPKAMQPRYNMLADTLLAVIGTYMLLKLFERRRALYTSFAFVGILMSLEAFVTVDPVSTSVFSNVNTNRFPMVYTASFASDVKMIDFEPGDDGYYNYQYTFIDKAIDKIIKECPKDDAVYIASSAHDYEIQFAQSDLRWDLEKNCRTYRDDAMCLEIKRVAADGLVKMTDMPQHVIFIESPWYHGDSKQALEILEQYYFHEGPQVIANDYTGSVLYFNMRLRSAE